MTGFDLSTIQDCRLGGTQMSAIYLGYTKIWPTGHDYSRDYFTIVSLEDNNDIKMGTTNENNTLSVYISTDDGSTWISYTPIYGESDVIANLNTGDKLLIKGTNNSYQTEHIYSTKTFNIEGNIMSLIYGDNFANSRILTSSHTFRFLFEGSKVVSIENLILPATTLTDHCYSYMFYNCKSLTTIPSNLLPATTLAIYCYADMFSGCTSLTTIPSNLLPATTLANYCYTGMFARCTILTTIPSNLLPATTLAEGCYEYMFYNCISLTTAPILPSTSLIIFCYRWMFKDCTALNSVTCYALNLIDNYDFEDYIALWLDNVSSTGTFYKQPNVTYPTGSSGIPSGWTIVNIS